MTLRPRHFAHVDSMARSSETIPDLIDKLTKGYRHFFGKLRIDSRSVPSDELRQMLIVLKIMALVQHRRDEIIAANRHEHIAAHDECST
jgi:hypothetical protein